MLARSRRAWILPATAIFAGEALAGKRPLDWAWITERTRTRPKLEPYGVDDGYAAKLAKCISLIEHQWKEPMPNPAPGGSPRPRDSTTHP